MTIVLISDGGLEQYACQQLALQLRRLGRRCLTVAPALTGPQPLPPCPADLRIDTPMQLLGQSWLNEASAIGVFLRDPSERQAWIEGYRALGQHSQHPPATLFSGPLLPLVGDALIQDISQRLSCDLLLLSGPQQLAQLAAMSFNWPSDLQPPPALATGFWFPPTPAPSAPAPSPLLVALIQERIPTHLGAREQLIGQLQRWARQHPDWTIVLQRDHGWCANQPLLPIATRRPINLIEAAPGQMLNLLARCTACLSVSSPWSLTAMSWGAKAVIAGDYGIQAEQNTVAWFGCGAMHRLRDIPDLEALHALPAVNVHWLEGMGGAITDGAARLLAALDRHGAVAP
ncbi:MAG: DUF6716 putative glycosyltransferase [Synechococcus sp.]